MGLDQLYGPGTTLNMNYRINRWFDAWYQPDVSMTLEEWQYIGLLCLVCLWSFGLGLLIGYLITL